MNISIKKRIYWSFSLLVCLFVINGIITIITLNNNKKLSENISAVIDPSLQAVADFQNVLVESKMYTTNWVFLRSNQQDKDALKNLHNANYPRLKLRLNLLFSKLDDKSMRDSLHGIFTGFEELLNIEKKLMGSLQKFEDYDDPVVKLEAERIVEDELLPRSYTLLRSLSAITSYEQIIRDQKNLELRKSSMQLRILISLLSITIIMTGIFLSLYMTRVIIKPVNKIRHIVNDLGKGKIIRKINNKIRKDEIGEMFRSVNNLSEKLHGTAAFAAEIGNRNFNAPFKPLSADDSLGIALIAMRDNIKLSDEKFNEAQHLSHIGSWERIVKTDRITMSQEMFHILDIEAASFDYQFQSILEFIHPDDLAAALESIKKNIDMPPVPFECRVITTKGVVKNIFIQTKIVHNKNGEIEKTFGIIQDITERKKAEEKITAEKELFRVMIESMPDQIYLKDRQSRFLLCNMPVAHSAGLHQQEQMIGKTDFDFYPPASANKFFKDEQSLMSSGKSIINDEQYTIDKITGKARWSLTTKVPLKGSAGEIIGLIGINHDITNRKISEKKIEDVNRELKILFNSIYEVFFSVDMVNLKVIQISESCEKLYGYGPSDFLANYKLWLQIIHPDDKHIIEKEDEIMESGEQVNNEYRIIRKDNTIRWVETKITPTLNEAGNLIRVDGVTRDITERKVAEKELEKSFSLLEATIESTADGILVADFNGKIVMFNKKFTELWHMPEQILAAQDDEKAIEFVLSQLINPEEFVSKVKELYIDREALSFDILKFKDGRTFERYSQPQLVNGSCVGRVWNFRDITEKKNAELALIERESQLTIAAKIAKLGYWELDVLKGQFILNDQFYSIFKTSTEKIGSNIMTVEHYSELFVHPDDRNMVGIEVENAINSADATFSRQIEHRIKYATGEIGWISVLYYIVKDNHGRTIKTFGVNQDITDRKHDEELLKRSQRSVEINNRELEQKNKELEQFAYVASHDLQEPLRTTISFVQIFKQQYFGKLDAKADKYLDYIDQASGRMRVLIKDLLDFSRIGHNKDKEQVDCNIILQDVIADIDKASKDAEAKIVAGHLPVISGYATELKQLFQNLILNSIKFRKKNTIPRINITAVQKNAYWQFAFADNGIGIDHQHSDRIFIIFQRLHTRTEYQGSGIGLSHCKKIVELHHGKIWVESTPGNGSTFYFTIHSPKEETNESKTKLYYAN